jgi:hypothetical protein
MGCNCPLDSLSEREDSHIRDGSEFQNLLGTESQPPIKREVGKALKARNQIGSFDGDSVTLINVLRLRTVDEVLGRKAIVTPIFRILGFFFFCCCCF